MDILNTNNASIIGRQMNIRKLLERKEALEERRAILVPLPIPLGLVEGHLTRCGSAKQGQECDQNEPRHGRGL